MSLPNELFITTPDMCDSVPYSLDEIRRRVNAHDDLLEALQRIEASLKKLYEADAAVSPVVGIAYANARAALAKVSA